ncbi:MAG: hypothetical protein OXC11_07820, partial [Rhodospirillales bacterium]|nr:hypothetical protein [Rhodospirillales bacterium]
MRPTAVPCGAGCAVGPERLSGSLRTDSARGINNGGMPMRIYATINEPLLRRSFRREQESGRSGLTVIDRDLPAVGLRVRKDGTRIFFVHVARRPGARRNIDLGTTDAITAAEAREKAVATIAAANAEREAGPRFSEFAREFLFRQARRWKPSTRDSNRHLMERYLVPFFGTLHVADIPRADVRRWFDAMSGAPGNANWTLPVLS